MRKRVPAIISAVVIVAALGIVVWLYLKYTAPLPLPQAPPSSALGHEGAFRNIEQLVKYMDRLNPEEREKYRTGTPEQQERYRLWAEAKRLSAAPAAGAAAAKPAQAKPATAKPTQAAPRPAKPAGN